MRFFSSSSFLALFRTALSSCVFITGNLIRFLFGEHVFAVFWTALFYENFSTDIPLRSFFHNQVSLFTSSPFFYGTFLTSMSTKCFFENKFRRCFRPHFFSRVSRLASRFAVFSVALSWHCFWQRISAVFLWWVIRYGSWSTKIFSDESGNEFIPQILTSCWMKFFVDRVLLQPVRPSFRSKHLNRLIFRHRLFNRHSSSIFIR